MMEQISPVSFTGPTMEESARQWWQQRFGTAMPEDVKTWLRGVIRKEVAYAHIKEGRLDDVTLQRVREARRLQQAKLSDVEKNLMRVRVQQEQTQRYIELTSELEQQRARLYELNKQQASQLTQQRDLERFETFEAIQGHFQRIHILNQGISQSRQTLGQLALRIDEARKNDTDLCKELEAERDHMSASLDSLIQASLTMSEAERLSEQVACQQTIQGDVDGLLRQYAERLTNLRTEFEEVRAERDRLDKELSALRLQRQSFEVHHQMILRSGAVQTMLDELLDAMNVRDALTNELNQTLRRQSERDEQLSKLFTQHQNLAADINARQEEVDGHRRNIAGQDSFSLQRRALELRSRNLMLKTGFSLWRNIAKGYDQMEFKEQQITAMRLRMDHLNRSIDAFESEVRKLDDVLQQKMYHWTLSKSQNVIELRDDLKEGTPCTVCGATHHPWGGEGISGQNALITTLKEEYATLSRELASKREQLLDMKQELTATTAKLETETANYQLLVERQKQDTDEWHNFASLDHSFVECSRSTNRDARTTMMRQLIEKTTSDAEDAEKELNTFTFHLDAISRIGEEIRRMQQTSSELIVRLNEVNTACQVMAGQVERLNQRLASATRNFSQRYTALDQEMSIPDWYREWTTSPEGVKMKIQEMTRQWNDLEANIHLHEAQIGVYSTHLELLQRGINEVQMDISSAENHRTSAEEQASKAENAMQKLLPKTDGKTYFQEARNELLKQGEFLMKREADYKEWQKQYFTLLAQKWCLDEIVRRDEARAADERSELDVWMQKYNANNPPVQFVELERVLVDGNDWTEVRKNVRSVALETAIVQARVDNLRAQIIALQAEGIRPNADSFDQSYQILRQQEDELEQKRRDILRQMAQLDQRLHAHEQTLGVIEEQEY